MNRRTGGIKAEPTLANPPKPHQSKKPIQFSHQRQQNRNRRRRRTTTTTTYNNSPYTKNQKIQNRQSHLPRTASIPALIHVQPEDTTEPEREPTSKQRTDQPQQIIKHRNRLRNNPRHRPQRKRDQRPHAITRQTLLTHPVRAAEQTDVDVLRRDVAVDHARDDDSRDSDAVGDFPHELPRGAEGGAGDGGAGVAVDDDGDDDVHCCVDALEEEEGFGVGGGVFEFGDEGEEGDVAGIGEDDVGDGQEAFGEGDGAGGGDVDVAGGWGDADADHGYHHGGDDGDECYNYCYPWL